MVRVVGEEGARGGARLFFAFVSGEGGENNDLLGISRVFRQPCLAVYISRRVHGFSRSRPDN